MINPKIITNNNLPSVIFSPVKSDSLTILVMCKIGSRYENDMQAGVSHFVEHMLFKSTKNRIDSKQIAMDIEMIGGITNAFTSYDYTGYYIKVPAKVYEKATEILGDIMNNSVFKETDFKKEKGVILEEIKMYNDRPTSRVAANWRREYYKNHALGRDIAGTLESVGALTLETLKNYYSKFYSNKNFIISVAGDSKYEEGIVEAISRYFLVEKPMSKLPIIENVLSVSANKVIIEKKDLEQAHVVLGFGVSRRQKRTEILSELVNTIISEGFGSRLFQKLREEMGIAYYLYSGFTLFNDSGRINIGFGTDLKKLHKVIEEVIGELNSLVNNGVESMELERAKNYYSSRIVFDAESTDELAAWVAERYVETGELLSISKIINNVDRITLDEINGFLDTEFRNKELLISIVGNLEQDMNNKFNLKVG